MCVRLFVYLCVGVRTEREGLFVRVSEPHLLPQAHLHEVTERVLLGKSALCVQRAD